MVAEKGTISINTENIFPIIKKFLYSDHEIFLRELVSNAVDATQKLKKLSSLGEFQGELGELKIKISFDAAAKTITVSDHGLGMTADEIKKYINQIAFSGAKEFLEKYKDVGDTSTQIIGNFGLGFYSAFMVSETVEINTLSYQAGAEAANWVCDGSTGFEINPTTKTERGTDVILHIATDSEEFLDKNRLQQILEKYGRFLPIEIEFEGEVLNNPNPLWTKAPADLKDEDYLAFYKELYPFSEDPLFWIHLNVDYPFNLTGVLYFPKIKNDLRYERNKIQLFSRQVFITDEVKDVVPEFLMLLHGVIDSPDIPLNVSRSFLQADSNVKKINGYITRKVADKLSEMFRNDRLGFEAKFNDIGLFVKYGMLSEDKFAEKAKEFCLLKNTENQYFTLSEYTAKVGVNQTDKNGGQVWLYASDPQKQDAFIQSARKYSYDVLVLDGQLDTHFVSFLEQKQEKTQLKRIDSEVVTQLIEKDETPASVLSEADTTRLKEVFEQTLNDKKLTVSVQGMPVDEMPVIVTIPEFMRRMKEMSRDGANGMMMFGDFPLSMNVNVNANHALSAKILASEGEAQQNLIKLTYDLALLSQGMLTGAELTAFIGRTLGSLKV